MKKVLSVLVCMLLTIPAFATGDATPTSKGYVDAQMATLQDNLPGAATNTVLTTTDTAGETGTKAIYDSTGNYVTQQDALVTAEDANTAIQMAINGELVCREYDPTGQYCYVYDVRHAIQSLLPAGYTALEYLESTYVQCINTGILSTSDVGVSVKFAIMEIRGYNHICGSLDPHLYVGITSTMTHLAASFGPASGSVILGIPVENIQIATPYTFDINFYNSKKAKVVNISQTDINTPAFTSSNGFYFGMFCSINGYPSTARIYNMKITDGDSLVRNFIPARRNSDSKLGMYDTVTNAFFMDINNVREFIAGPDLNVYLPSGQ